jgi:hypothetical protein
MAEMVKLCGEALVPSTFAVYGKATTKPLGQPQSRGARDKGGDGRAVDRF